MYKLLEGSFGKLFTDSYLLKAEGLSLSVIISEFFLNPVFFSIRGRDPGNDDRKGEVIVIFDNDSEKLNTLF